MNLIKSSKNHWQINTIWDLGRILLSFGMSYAGAFLLSMLFSHLFGLTSQSLIFEKILFYIPFIIFGFFLGTILLKVFISLKSKIKSEKDFWLIMLSFSLAGMFIMPVRKAIFHLLGITAATPLWIKVLVYIPIIPPTYYVGLMFFGTILGQRTYFWGMVSSRLRFLTGRKNVKH